MTDQKFPTSLGVSTVEEISLMGKSVAQDLMGQVSFSELAYWLVAGRRPSAGQQKMFDAVLVSLADHGFTPTAIAARLTYLSAPESVQGAVAAGLLGGGSRFLGVTEDSAKYLQRAIEATPELPTTEAGWDQLAITVMQASRANKEVIPGLGHPVHKNGDPRVPVIYDIAESEGVLGPYLSLFAAMGRVSETVLGKKLPLNGAGVAGAALADIDLPVDMLRGFALLARTAGLLGHIAEEKRMPMAMDVYMTVDRNAQYIEPEEVK